jgi:glycine cleavage system aminomethyltransferase T
VSRRGAEHFWVIGGAVTRRRDLDTLERAAAGRHATVTDLTSAYACLAVMGPAARELLCDLTQSDLSDAAFPFATHHEIDVTNAMVWANRRRYDATPDDTPVEAGLGFAVDWEKPASFTGRAAVEA